MVLAPHREGGQAQFIEQPVAEDRRDTVLGALLADLRSDLNQDMSIDSLASRVAMSRRTFTRRFGKATGMSVARWIDAERLRKAKDLLRSEEHTSELQSLMRISYAVFCLKKKQR